MIKSFSLAISYVHTPNGYRYLSIKPRDLKALGAWLIAFADSPERVDTCIGPFSLQIDVEVHEEVAPPPKVGFGG